MTYKVNDFNSKPEEDVQAEVTDLFREKLEHLLTIDDSIYARYSIEEDPISRKIKEEDQEEIIRESIKAGEAVAEDVLAKHSRLPLKELIVAQGIELIIEEEPETVDFVYFGTYETKGPITLYKGNILNSERLIEEHKIDGLTTEILTEIILAHELFHYYEDQYPDLYTNVKEIELWTLGPYTHKSTLVCPSEIAAMAFTKHLLQLDFNPAAINYLLFSSFKKDNGEVFYNRIIQLENKHNK